MPTNPPASFCRFLAQAAAIAAAAQPLEVRGRLTRVAGLVMEAVGLKLPLGAQVVVVQEGGLRVDAEVVGFAGDRLFLMPTAEPIGLKPGATVLPYEAVAERPRLDRDNHPWRRAEDRTRHLPLGDALLGRVLDPNGRPLDKRGPLVGVPLRPLARRPINAMERERIAEPLDVGVRAINALLTVGRGQRMGLFAGAGVGKSVLLGMMARYTAADVTVVGLIGERGREVKEFIEDILGEAGLARAVVVAAPADTPPLLRMQGAAYATAIAEHFRDQGKQVLLLLDSLTRYAMAAREIALAIGEPPATKGYPPSVFARLPQLVERAGNAPASDGRHGSITAFYTVLIEGDDPHDPVADAARAILDGHIVLSRALADAGHYPAIDIEASISRVMNAVVGPDQIEMARRFKALYSRYMRNRDLLSVGAYVAGSDRLLDAAIEAYPRMEAFLQQRMDEPSTLAEAHGRLAALLDTIPLT
ncbi:MAG: flagellar protein export ATPase FliI [Sutterellaceae bacterium]|nr:flagellar protein export ATPase FliI [Burkholderiaceae bacterium]MDW8431014.1 flagellar protein export ATPase FliI [Sutterellaceae bacterium]